MRARTVQKALEQTLEEGLSWRRLRCTSTGRRWWLIQFEDGWQAAVSASGRLQWRHGGAGPWFAVIGNIRSTQRALKRGPPTDLSRLMPGLPADWEDRLEAT